MRISRAGIRPSLDTVAVALLGVSSLVVAALLAQSLLTLRSHERTVAATLADFSAFAAEGVAAELDWRFTSIFLDQIALGRSAHYAWTAGDDGTEGVLPPARWAVPDEAIPAHFSISEGRVIARGGSLSPEDREWILGAVGEHSRDVYPRPAPYAVLRDDGPEGPRTVVYRREEFYGRVNIYGFLVNFEAFAPTYAQVLEDAAILPRSLDSQVDPADLLRVTLLFPQEDGVLFQGPGPPMDDPVQAEAFAAKAGRMAVRVELDAARARSLVPGGTARSSITLFVALAGLTIGLFGLAVVLLQRAARLTRLRETFVANVSHDLRTPLAQIRMFSETLLLGRMTDAGEQQRSLEIIRQQATNLGDLVDNILLASNREHVPLRPTSTDLNAAVSDTLDALRPYAEEKRARLLGSVAGASNAVLDAAALRRVLVNLVDNALKYGPDGQEVTVRLTNRDDFLDVVVEDQGPGVPRRDRLRVWERFRRIDHPQRTITGTGIGLAVVRDLAERHGGSVRLDAGTERGARVTVTLALGDLVRT
jgi:signal transduction histidine kinase